MSERMAENPRDAKPLEAAQKPSWWSDWGRTFVLAILFALVIRAFLFQPFNIPSGSMIPTLHIGDYLFVSKFSYGFSKHSFPFSPNIMEGRIMESMPERGDIAVFKTPADNRTDYIKRVIGLPGDRVQMKSGVLYLNGTALQRERIEDFDYRTAKNKFVKVARYRETLPNGVSYETLDIAPNSPADNTREFEVPAGHYFMVGDNRDSSLDSRVDRGIGFVPAENLVGKAQVRWLATDNGAPFFAVWAWKFDRMFESVY